VDVLVDTHTGRVDKHVDGAQLGPYAPHEGIEVLIATDIGGRDQGRPAVRLDLVSHLP
jgi:hypothetical protein